MPKFSKKRAFHEEDDDDSQEDVKPIKKPKASAGSSAGAGKDGEGNPFWELSSKRRVTVSKFKKITLVNIREYYEADGELRPGKKGISLSIEQYQALVKAVPAINAALLEQGHTAEEVDPDEAEKLSGLVTKTKTKVKSKPNIEATSDEDSG